VARGPGTNQRPRLGRARPSKAQANVGSLRGRTAALIRLNPIRRVTLKIKLRGLSAKVVRDLLGHSSITMTLDTYGHLFPRGDDRAELAKASRLLLA